MADPRAEFEREILRQRTRAAASTETVRHHETARAIDFTVAGERHAIEFDVLRAVMPVDELTPVPRAPRTVAGLMLVESRVVPVFELAALLGMPPRGLPERSFVLLLGRDRVEVGIRVDKVGSLLALELERPFAQTGQAPVRSEWIRGLGPDGVPVVDGERLLASDRLHVDVALPDQPEPFRSREAT